MKRITKTLASEIAEKIYKETIGVKIDLLKKVTGDRADEIMKAVIPSTILDDFIKYPDYFDTAKRIRLRCESIESPYEVCTSTIFPSNKQWCRYVDVSRVDFDWFLDKNDELKALSSEAKKMVATIEQTLLSLATFKRVAEEFEEAAKYLPSEKEEERRVSLPIEELNVLINKYR